MSEIVFPTAAVSRLRMDTDGEGITTLVCGWGCPLRCRYCINRFTWSETTEIRRLTPEELYNQVKQDSLYFEATGGGITFGGGEPLLYAEFFPEFRKDRIHNSIPILPNLVSHTLNPVLPGVK